MPGLGRHPCTSCHYVASNRRMLARHSALIHCDKVFKCPVCPFITRYAANWYRHKRDQHGLSKLTTCDDCGFSANSPSDLAQHREAEHPDVSQLQKIDNKYAKEKVQLNEVSENKASEVSRIEKDLKNDSDLLLDIYDIDQEIDINLPPNGDDINDESVKFTSSFNGHFSSDFAEGDRSSISKESSPEAFDMNDIDASSDNLRPLRIRRSYNCDQCGLLTNNPREYLYHLRNVHGENISVHECKYCIYASKHIQKLQRHCNLVHRQQIEKDPEFKRLLEATKDKKGLKPDVMTMGMSMTHQMPNETFQNSGMVASAKLSVKSKPQTNFFHCNMCAYRTRNKSLLFHHEKSAHVKKKNFRCTECGYVTNDKSRFAKHIKYHNLPKMQCQFCFFKTAYKWNMERHMKNHEVGAIGNFRCSECNFTTSTKQSYNAHITNHHDPCADDNEDQELQDINGDNNSNDWEDISMQENEDDIIEEDSGNFDSYEFSESSENPDNAWKQGKPSYERNLKCQQCDFRAAWPFELKKHEENHRSQKKHPCPLCGMRFEHVAWLTKHLRRIHAENSQAKNIAAAYDLLKPARRRPGKPAPTSESAVLPMYQDVLKHSNAAGNNKNSDPGKSSMLSTLLKKPLHPYSPASASRYSTPFKSKAFNPSSNFYKQPRISNYYQKVSSPQPQEPSDTVSINSKKVPTCNVCGYKTRWISELQRHMRVHSQEKPFQCHKCKYVCKWKGDLNRHLMKYHGIKTPTSKKGESVKYTRKSDDNLDSSNEWPDDGGAKRNLFSSTAPGRSSQDSPLDLTLGRETFPHPNAAPSPYDAYDFDSHLAMDSECEPIDVLSYDNPSSVMYSGYKSQMSLSNGNSLSSESPPPNPKLKYQCPSCPFNTTTASRFHVHIVQHYNKRPFMCSVCGYNSNWEWDITKHIRLKGCRDTEQNKACVLLTDETGKRNYEKYEKYLVDVTQPIPVGFPSRLPELNGPQDNAPKFSMPKQPNYNESSNKSCSYDFRNIGSNFEDSPINIVVTPDINLPDPPEEQDNYMNNMLDNLNNENLTNPNETKYFFCKHCSFKHTTKRVVVSHLSTHAGLKPFRCRACGMVSNWRHVIVRHVKDVHNGYMNEVEERINFVQEGYGLRLVSVTEGNEESNLVAPSEKPSELFGCKICPYKCDKEFYMNFHMKQHKPRDGAIFKCDYCPYFVKFKKTLVRHMKLHNPSPSSNNIEDNLDYQNAQIPSQQYSNEIYNFNDLQPNESNDESIAISFDQLSQLDPNSSPQKIKRHICEHCPYKTDNKTQYLYHKQFHRPNPSAAFKCNDCSYWATMQHLMTQHTKVHSDANSDQSESPVKNNGPRQFFEFFDDKNLPETISIIYVKKGEENVKMFKCGFCPMMNKKKANVRVHQKMHGVIINDGKYACMYCNYQCLNQGGLTNHMKVHQRPGEDERGKDFSPRKFYDFDDEGMPIRKRTNSYFCYKCPAIFKTANDLLSHSKFHGSILPLKCTYCDYRVKQKPHITQHLNVHTAEYKAKRKAANPLNPESSPTAPESVEDATTEDKEVIPFKKIDQMLLLEESELKAALSKTGEAAQNVHKCIFCPAAFCKTSILVYHVSLHGSMGDYKCTQCDYSVNRIENLIQHNQVHPPKKSPAKRNLKSYSCNKCPTIFYKQDRYERHLELHGKGYRFACTECDYSVRFAANLIKHRKIHASHVVQDQTETPTNPNEIATQKTENYLSLSDSTNLLPIDEKRVAFICDRCPYNQLRKDAVQNHQKRHLTKANFDCPYCDYSCMQTNFLSAHVRLHVQPNNLFPAQAFMKFESFKIYIRDENDETLLFDDEVINPRPAISSTEIPDNEENAENIPQMETENVEEVKKDVPGEKVPEKVQNIIEESTNQAVRDGSPKFYIENSENFHTDSNLSSSSSKSNKVPIVVLSDIFANDKDLKKWGNRLKIPKLKISRKYPRSSSSEQSCKKLKVSDLSHCDDKSKKSKPSLVVKIKVENCRINKHEKTLYSVSTKSADDPPLKSQENSLESAENTNDSTSEMFQDSEASLPTATSTSPVNDIEENTLTSSPDEDIALKASDSGVSDMVDSIVESATNDIVLPQPSSENIDLKSTDSFSNDTVPVVSDILCGKLDCLTDLSFKDSDLSLTNGDCSNHIPSSELNLLPEEIKVGL